MNKPYQHSNIWRYAITVTAISLMIVGGGIAALFLLGKTFDVIKNFAAAIALVWFIVHFVYADANRTLDECFVKLDASGYLPNLRPTIEQKLRALHFWWVSSLIAHITLTLLTTTFFSVQQNQPPWFIYLQYSAYILMLFSSVSISVMLVLREQISQFRRDTEEYLNILRRKDSVLKGIRESPSFGEENEYLLTHGRRTEYRASDPES